MFIWLQARAVGAPGAEHDVWNYGGWQCTRLTRAMKF